MNLLEALHIRNNLQLKSQKEVWKFFKPVFVGVRIFGCITFKDLQLFFNDV
jgi:hypothetical protein